MANPRLKELRGPDRRNFLRLMGVAGAAFALERSKVLNFIADEGGSALADDAVCSTVNRSVHMVAGNGSFGWYQLLWPHVAIAQAGNPQFAYHESPANTMFHQGDKMFAYAPEAPWQAMDPPLRMTAFMSGKNETHELTPKSQNVASNATLCGTVAAIQRAQPVLLPVIGVGPVNLGVAPGAPAVATVPSGAAMVELFNSAASQVTLALKENKDLYETYYKAILGLREAAGRPTWARQLEVTKKASNLLSRNLAAQLTPTQADLDAYGIGALSPSISNGNAKEQLTNIGRSLITTARAFKLGVLTNSVMIATTDVGTGDDQFTDPHKAFTNMPQLQAVVALFGQMFNAFYKDLASSPDPSCPNQTLDKSVIFTVHGDTPKTPRQTAAWPDGTEGDSNWLYVMGGGYVKTGWYGGINADGSVVGFNPATGEDVAGQASNVTTGAACAAVAYAVAKGNLSKVKEFYQGDFSGIVNKNP